MKLTIYDKKQGILTFWWWLGAHLFKFLGRTDEIYGVSSFEEMKDLLLRLPDKSISRLEYYGHGHQGGVSCNGKRVDDGHYFSDIASKFHRKSLVWWRTCSAFSSEKGHDFARECTEAFGCRVAGHTYIIWLWQGGLHVLKPLELPDWTVHEGIREDGKNKWSNPWSPNSLFLLSYGV